MQLLIQRGQKSGKLGGSPVFVLWAKFEITPEEEALIQKYSMKKFALVEGNFWPDFLKAVRIAAVCSVVVFIGVVVLYGVFGIVLAVQSGLVILLLGSVLIYQQIKETILVGDILFGKRFACKSVATLIAKEKTLTELAQDFRFFLEAMKTWGGRGVVEIEPGQAPQFRIVEHVHGAA